MFFGLCEGVTGEGQVDARDSDSSGDGFVARFAGLAMKKDKGFFFTTPSLLQHMFSLKGRRALRMGITAFLCFLIFHT